MFCNSNINFNQELEKLMNETDYDDVSDESCLISKEKLDDSRVKLECGHVFNYNPLYHEIYQQKYGV